MGLNIRRLRQHANLTVTALSEKAGMTKSTLSKIETGQVSAPISTLLRIAEALEVTISEFFVEEETNPPFVLTRKGKGRLTTRNGSQWGYAYESLALEMKYKIGEPFLLTIKPGEPKGKFQHGGQEFIYMLSGRMIFTVGEHVMQLNPGDSLYFDPTRVHTTQVLGKQPARFICVFMQDRPKQHRKESPS
ncbi:MAG: XRE family transcriptional regulator [Kiritimatiellae bacterium]|nr:XRE family transcriptional regulator [Kiritimatiellia bacterium]MDD5521006.1 XRE family transcriptional regulator [Kiritimatiellia bacterium]